MVDDVLGRQQRAVLVGRLAELGEQVLAVALVFAGAPAASAPPLLTDGMRANLASLVARGRTWDLESLNPMISPLIWTTIATGRSPVDHGVADFQELDPKTRARLPISGWSRKVPAVWNVASEKGLKVVGSADGQKAFNMVKGSIPARSDVGSSRLDLTAAVLAARPVAVARRGEHRGLLDDRLAVPVVADEARLALEGEQ